MNNSRIYTSNDNNVDSKEINKFKKIAYNWWDLKGKFRILHHINRLRLSYIAHRSDGLFGKKVLDVGCGGGILSESMTREGAIVTGLDVESESLKIAYLHSLESGIQINYVHETVEEHAVRHAHQYDIITCMEMLEHVPDPNSIVTSCALLVKPGGEVFFSTINRNIIAWLIVICGAEYVLCKIPKGTHNIKKFIKPAELLNWIDQTCLTEQHITGIYYNPLMNRFRFSDSVYTNYILHTKAKD